MPPEHERPLLNPVLRLKMEAQPKTPHGGGKGRQSVVQERFAAQQRILVQETRALYQEREALPSFGGRTHMLVRMFGEDSLAPSHTPNDLFSPVNGCQLVAPYRGGYVVEVEVDALPSLTRAIQEPVSFGVRADISRVEWLGAYGLEQRLRRRSLDELWNAAIAEDEGRLFVIWLAPFRNRDAQENVLRTVTHLAEEQVLLPIFTTTRLITSPGGDAPSRAVTTPRQSSIARVMRNYRNSGVGRATVRIPSQRALDTLLASGISHRIDPVRPIRVAAPGHGTEPPPPMAVADAPIVGIVDGGLHATSYTSAEAWRANPPLVSNGQADRAHGNVVSSLAVQGHAWNGNRPLPTLTCRIGTVQAVPHRNANRSFNERELIDYLATIIRVHPETRVWNISANQEGSCLDPDEVSALGHEINELARTFNVLPVISVGNAVAGSGPRPSPPADCEAAITVGGRLPDADGNPGDGCPVCLGGPGPDGMLKPDLSWFSELRAIGGGTQIGSSYPTPLVSSLAAHAFANLREATPDLVKALLINTAERHEHDAKLGWGTPYQGRLPWNCEEGSVTLAWRAQLEPGAQYYWNDIPIPPEFVRQGRLMGRVSLTAILRPMVSPFGGANYFASRLETSIRRHWRDKWHSIAGSMMESSLSELEAREELKKWQPVRHHYADFSTGTGLPFSGDHLQLYARIYMRDLYQFGYQHHSQAGVQDVAFVLTFWSADGNPGIYNSMVQSLGNFVESAVVNQEIDVENE